MKGFMTLVLAVGLVLGVSSVYAQELVITSPLPTGAPVRMAPASGEFPPPLVITSPLPTGVPVRMAPAERTVAERGKAEAREAGVTSVYKETGYISDQTERFVW